MCAALFSKSELDQKYCFLHPFLDLVSVSNIHDRGHKHDVYVYIGVNHVIITQNILFNDIFHFGYYSYFGGLTPSSAPPPPTRKYSVFALTAPILMFSFPHTPKALNWECGIHKNVTPTIPILIFLFGVSQFHIFYWLKTINLFPLHNFCRELKVVCQLISAKTLYGLKYVLKVNFNQLSALCVVDY